MLINIEEEVQGKPTLVMHSDTDMEIEETSASVLSPFSLFGKVFGVS